MPLQVASCPRCKSPLVFGEQACTACGQSFQYGANAPPAPSLAQIAEALAAAGAPPRRVPTSPNALASAQASLAQAVAARTQPAQQQQRLDGLDTGRAAPVGDVELQEVPGLIDSTLFKAFTPKHVEAQQVFGFDAGRFADTGNTAPIAEPAGLERTARDDVGDQFTQPVSGLFGSNIYDTTKVQVAPPPVDGLDPSPSVARATTLKRVKDEDLTRILCRRCQEAHRLPRCPACGEPHPDAGARR